MTQPPANTPPPAAEPFRSASMMSPEELRAVTKDGATPRNDAHDDYPNLSAITNGTISGRFSEWPLVKPEITKALARIAALEAEVARLKATHLDCIDEQASQANIMTDLRTRLDLAERALAAAQAEVARVNWNMGLCEHDRTGDGRAREELGDVTVRDVLNQLAICDLHEGNCAGFDVANRRIRNLANKGLAALATTPPATSAMADKLQSVAAFIERARDTPNPATIMPHNYRTALEILTDCITHLKGQPQ